MTDEQRKIRILFRELKKAPAIPFPLSRQKLRAPNEKGVYIIYSPSGNVLHVGCTPRAAKGIAQRLRNHMQSQSSFAHTYMKQCGYKLRGRYKFKYLIVHNARRRVLLEAFAIGYLCPAHIGKGQALLNAQ